MKNYIWDECTINESFNEKKIIKEWFFNLKEKDFEHLKIITNQNLCVFVINMIKIYKETKNDLFKIKENNENIYFKKIFKNNPNNLINVINFIEFKKKSINYDKKKNFFESEFLKIIRLYTNKNWFDSIMIYYRDKKKIWEICEVLSDYKFLLMEKDKIMNFKSNKVNFNVKTSPNWINFNNFNSISEIILSQFEFNIIKEYYKKKYEKKVKPTIKNPVKENLETYKSLSEKEKINIVKNILNNDFNKYQKINLRLGNINVNYLKLIKIENNKQFFESIISWIKNKNYNEILEKIYYPCLNQFTTFECMVLGEFGIKLKEINFQKFLFNIQECKSESYDLERIVSNSSEDYSNNISDSYGSNKKNRNKSIQKLKKKIIYVPKNNIKNKKKWNHNKNNKEEFIKKKSISKEKKKINHINFLDKYFSRKTNSVFNTNLEKINESTLSVRDIEKEEVLVKNSEIVSKSFKTRTLSTRESSLYNKLCLIKKKTFKNPSEISFNVTPEKTSIKNNFNDNEEFFSTIKSTEENKKKIKKNENFNKYYNKEGNKYKNQKTEIKKLSFKKILNFKQKTIEFKLKKKKDNIIKEKLDNNLLDININQYFFNLIDIEIKKKLKLVKNSVNLNKNCNLEIINKIKRNILSNLNNNVQIFTFGSFETNLMTNFSDIDLLIISNFQDKKIFLNKISVILKKIEFIKKINLILSAKVPVIKIEALNKNNSLINIDIIVDKDINESTATKTTNYVKKCIIGNKNFKNLFMIWKILLQNYNLMNSYLGGLNSYGLAILVNLFLNIDENIDLKNISLIFLKFWEFYSFKVNFKIQMVNPFADKNYPISIKLNQFLNSDLVIWDPTLNYEKNIISNGFLISNIHNLFLNILKELEILKNKISIILANNINNRELKNKIDIPLMIKNLKLNLLNFLI